MPPFRLLLLLVISAVFGLGLFDYLTNFEKNECEMTYMYEVPQYLPVKLDQNVQQKYPRYSLYLYAEGQYAEESKAMRLSGIPVLFIPGNAGSHRQVRSLGSVALRKAKDTPTKFHFNYFSIDFNEELSGLFGYALQEQTEFAYECIKKILSMYKGAASPPKTVVLVGHSMGGMVARALFTLPQFKVDLVNTLITQATPHQAPPVAIDYPMRDFYQRVNSFWEDNNNTTLKDVTVLSTGGGYRDILVRGGLTGLSKIVTGTRGVSSNTMSTPRAWASTDHLCHVWCKQIVLVTKRALFDIVDRSTKQIAVNPSYRWQAFQHHFVRNPGPRRFKGAYDDKVQLDKAIKWEIRQKKSWKISRESLAATRYSAMEIPIFSDTAFVAISNIKNENWLGTCTLKATKTKAGSKMEERCSQINNMAPWATLVPPLYSEKKVVHLDNEKLKEKSHLVTILPKSKSSVEVTAEMYSIRERHLEFNVTTLLDFLLSFPRKVISHERIINKTAPNAVFYNISLNMFDVPLQAYTAHLIARKCTEKPTGGSAGSLLHLHVPWSHEDTYAHIRPGKSGNLSLKLQTGRPMYYPGSAQLHVYLIPTCTYRLTISIAWMELFGQFVRFYATFLPGFFVIQVLMALSWQLKMLEEQGVAPDFSTSHGHWAQPWRVVPLAIALRFLICFPDDDNVSLKLGLPLDDSAALYEQNMWYAALPILLYLVAYASVGLYSFIVQYLIIFKARVLGLVFSRCCGSPRVEKLAARGQYLLYLAALGMSAGVCGTLGILTVYLAMVIKLMHSYTVSRRAFAATGHAREWNRFNVQLTLLLLLMLSVVMCAPSLLVWAHNFKYSPVLVEDPSRITGIVISVAAILLDYGQFPLHIGEWFGVTSSVLYIHSIVMVLYTMQSTYRVTGFICSALLFLAVPVALVAAAATRTTPAVDQPDEPEDTAENKKTQ